MVRTFSGYKSPSASGNSNSKGQWFIISAVVVTGVFLVISQLFKTYSLTDSSDSARANEDVYFNNIKQQFSAVVQQSDCPVSDMGRMDRNLREYRAFAEREMNNLGYIFFMTYTINSCAAKDVAMGLLIGSSRFVIYEGVNPEDVLG